MYDLGLLFTANVPRGVLRSKIPSWPAPKCNLLHFVCIAKRVTGHAVNSNDPGKGMGAAGIFGYLQIGFAVLK